LTCLFLTIFIDLHAYSEIFATEPKMWGYKEVIKNKKIIFEILLPALVIFIVVPTTALAAFGPSEVVDQYNFNVGTWTKPCPPKLPCERSTSCECGVTFITNPTTQSVDFLKFPTCEGEVILKTNPITQSVDFLKWGSVAKNSKNL
jgi:hypothetical protein